MRCGFGLIGGEVDPTRCSSRARREAFGDHLGCLTGTGVENGSEQLAKGIGRNTADCVIWLDELLLHHLHSDTDSGKSCSLAVAGLQHEKATVFDGELEILHVVKVALQGMPNILELTIDLGHLDLKLKNGLRRTNACDHILALRIEKKLTIKNFLARCGVASEGDSRTAVISGVTEDHTLDIDGRAPLMRDVIFPAVDDGSFIIPRSENGTDRTPELLAGIFRKVLTCAFPNQLTETVG